MSDHEQQTEAAGGLSAVDRLVGQLIEMHNHPPSKIGWLEQTTLREAAETLSRVAKPAQKPPGLYVGTVKYVRAGGNAGLSWYVAPDYESVEYGYQPNEGDLLYAVPNVDVTGASGAFAAKRPCGQKGSAS